MSLGRTILTAAAFGLLSATSARAADAIASPDPSGVTLFGLGLAGLLIGRRIAGKRGD